MESLFGESSRQGSKRIPKEYVMRSLLRNGAMAGLAAGFGLLVGVGSASADHVNPCAASANPCAAKTANPCAGQVSNPCSPQASNPCSAETAERSGVKQDYDKSKSERRHPRSH